MINLLPFKQREEIEFARHNTRLLRWIVAMVFIIIGLVIFIGGGYYYLSDSIDQMSHKVEEKQANLQQEDLEATEQRVEELSDNFNLVLDVLSEQVLFSRLLPEMGSVMPPGSVLSNIEISEVEGGIDLVAYARDYDTATQTQVNLEDPSNKLFEEVDIVSISCEGSDDETYPCTVNLRALFTDDNKFLLLSESEVDDE